MGAGRNNELNNTQMKNSRVKAMSSLSLPKYFRDEINVKRWVIRAFCVISAVLYYVFDRTEKAFFISSTAAVLWIAVYSILKFAFLNPSKTNANPDGKSSNESKENSTEKQLLMIKRFMSVISSIIVFSIAAYAYFFDENLQNESLIANKATLSVILLSSVEIGFYFADVFLFTNAQLQITSLIVHHLAVMSIYIYPIMRGLIFARILALALLMEGCNPFWYMHWIWLSRRVYEHPQWKYVFYANAFMATSLYLLIRFFLASPRLFYGLYLCYVEQIFWGDFLYLALATAIIHPINIKNTYKLVTSILSTFKPYTGKAKPSKNGKNL